MLNTVMHTTRRALVAVRRHPITAEFNAREKLAFEILHPQVQVVKNSPTAQVVAGTIIGGLFLTGNWGTAAAVAGCWLGSKPLTHLVAGGVSCVGVADGRLLAAIQRLQAIQAEPA